MEVYGLAAGNGSGPCSSPSAASTPSARASRSTRWQASTWPCPGAIRRSAADIAGSRWWATRSCADAEAVRRRDFTINALLFDPLTATILDLVGGRRDLDDRILRAVDHATFGDDSLRVLRGLQFAARFGLRMDDRDARPVRVAAARRPGERARLRRSSRSSCCGPHAVGGLRPRPRTRRDAAPVPRDGHPRRLSAGAGVAPRGRRLDTHADGHRPGSRRWSTTSSAGARWRCCWARSATTSASRPPRPSSTDASARPITKPRACAPAVAFLDRLNVHTIDDVDVRAQVLGMVQYHLAPGMWHKAASPVSDGAFRRLVTEGRSGVARAAGARGLPRAHGPVRLFGDGLVPDARQGPRRGTPAAGSDPVGPARAGPRPGAGPRRRARAQGRLRDASWTAR